MSEFTFGELHGGSNGFPCEIEGCNKNTWTVILSDDEEKRINRNDGTASLYINMNKLGLAKCQKCIEAQQ